MCDPWKLLASMGVIAGSAYHFWDKYINVERKEEEKLIILEKKICTKETCPCVQDDCKTKTEEKEELNETDEDLKKRCSEFKENSKKKRAELREKLKRKIKEGQEKNEEEKMKKLGFKPKKKEQAMELSQGQNQEGAQDQKADTKDKGPPNDRQEDSKVKASAKKVDSKGKAPSKDKKAKEAPKG